MKLQKEVFFIGWPKNSAPGLHPLQPAAMPLAAAGIEAHRRWDPIRLSDRILGALMAS